MEGNQQESLAVLGIIPIPILRKPSYCDEVELLRGVLGTCGATLYMAMTQKYVPPNGTLVSGNMGSKTCGPFPGGLI